MTELSRRGELYRKFTLDKQLRHRYHYEFDGIKTPINDETATNICSFRTSAGFSVVVEMDLSWGSILGAAMCAQTDKIKFVYTRDNVNNVTVSAVSVVNSVQVLDGIISLTATYTATYDLSSDRVIVAVTHNNETTDISMACGWWGKCMMFSRTSGGILDTVLMYTAH